MAEGLSPVEVGKNLGEHAEAAKEDSFRERNDRTISIIEAVLLAIVAVLAAWSGFSSAKWGTDSRLYLAQSSTARNLSTQANLDANTLKNFDASTFNAWFTAYVAGNRQAEQVAERRFRPQFAVAFDAWISTDPMNNPHAPPGPTYMPQYKHPELALSNALDATSLIGKLRYSFGGTGAFQTSGSGLVASGASASGTVTLSSATSGSFTVCPLGDVNLDGVVNAADIDAVYAHFGDTTGRYDLNGDGVLNQDDVDYLVKTILHTGYGDANLDGKVDFTDFQVLLDHWQNTGAGWATGDWTGDGTVDFLDFQKLIDNWNPTGAGGTEAAVFAAQAVPAATNQITARSTPAFAAAAVSSILSSNGSLSPAAATLTPIRRNAKPPLIQVADLLAPRMTSNASVYVPTARASVLSRWSSLTDASWTSDNKVDLLTQLIRPVVA